MKTLISKIKSKKLLLIYGRNFNENKKILKEQINLLITLEMGAAKW